MATPSSAASSATSVQQQKLHEKLADVFSSLFGVHPGYRPMHAKGIVCEGTFTPAAGAASLSRAPHLQRESVPVTVRFSDSTGVPNIPDGDPNASPRGLGIKFQLPGGAEADIVAHSVNGFPAGTAEEFLELLEALAASGPDAPKPTPIEAFLGTHPRALKFVTTPKPAPASFASESYYAINAFRFTNRDGASRFARYQIHPVGGEAHLSDAEAAQRRANYLFEELGQRLARGPVEMRLVAELAEPGDPVNNPSITWPDDRTKLELGTIRLVKLVADSDAAQRKLIFDPVHIADGIELSDDPLPAVRSAVYAISYQRRNA